ncbi:MAG: hypothetical protein EBX30_09050 [Betaproteobacteria bacterium]|nr:hypothetical protein [Betaproteobacteria bacterium]
MFFYLCVWISLLLSKSHALKITFILITSAYLLFGNLLSNLRNVLRRPHTKVVRALKQLLGLLFCFTHTLATRKIIAYTLAQMRMAMTNDTQQ